jgi:hypothetical protein
LVGKVEPFNKDIHVPCRCNNVLSHASARFNVADGERYFGTG